MAVLQVRDVDDRLYSSLKQRAWNDNRSIGQEVISILEKYLATPDNYHSNATREFLNLSWEDERDADEIIKDLRKDRRNKKIETGRKELCKNLSDKRPVSGDKGRIAGYGSIQRFKVKIPAVWNSNR